MPSPSWQPCVGEHEWLRFEIMAGFGYEYASACNRCGIIVLNKFAGG